MKNIDIKNKWHKNKRRLQIGGIASLILGLSVGYFINTNIPKKRNCLLYMKGKTCETYICDTNNNGLADTTEIYCKNQIPVRISRKPTDEEKIYFIENK